MSEEKKAGRERKCAPFEDPSFMKELQGMLGKGDFDCAEMMSRMKAMCCGDPKEPGEQKESVEKKSA